MYGVRIIADEAWPTNLALEAPTAQAPFHRINIHGPCQGTLFDRHLATRSVSGKPAC